jgi:cytochrome c biogenesis protein CcmG/thiol:disulfide interchange protein DsbE
MKKIGIFGIPIVVFFGLSIFLFKGLFSDPRQLDSLTVDRPIPSFQLPDLFDVEKIYSPEVFEDQVTLLNVWGVWCVTCAVELPYLTKLADEEGLRVVGLYYDQDLDPDFGTKKVEDVQAEATTMLARFGNPYAFQIFDVRRELSLDLGVTGAPEHFLIDKNGIVRWHHVGDINERVWRQLLKPQLTLLRDE